MKITAILLISLLIAFISGCQDHNLEPHTEDVMAWRAGGPQHDLGNNIAVDREGNVYVTGSFTGTATFGTTTLTAAGATDVFVTKYNQLGEVIWVKQAGGPNSVVVGGIALDESGNVYVTGYFSGTAGFGTTSLTSTGETDIFIARYTSSGEVVWARRAGGTTNDYGADIAVDGSGNLYITGNFSGTAGFGMTFLTSLGGLDLFVARYNSSGEVVWVQRAGSTGFVGGSGIAVDESGNAYITGSFRGTATFGANTLTAITQGQISFNIYVAKYSSTGEVLWARRSGIGFASGIAVDKSGNVYVTGEYFDSPIYPDIFLTKLNTNGEGQWFRFIGSKDGIDSGTGVAVDNNGNVYLVGNFRSHFPQYNIGGSGLDGRRGAINLVPYGLGDILVAKFDSNANLIWAKNAGGAGDDFGGGIAVDAHGTAYVTGSFRQTATFGSTTLTSSGESDIFVAKYK